MADVIKIQAPQPSWVPPLRSELHTARDVERGEITYDAWMDEIRKVAQWELDLWQAETGIHDILAVVTPKFLNPVSHDIEDWPWMDQPVLYAVDFRKKERCYRWINPDAPSVMISPYILELPEGYSKYNMRPRWANRSGSDKKLTPSEFIRKYYVTEIEEGSLHRGIIHQEDKSLYIALANWLRNHDLPSDLNIPTYIEWNTQKLAEIEAIESPSQVITTLKHLASEQNRPEADETVRLHNVARKRRAKRRQQDKSNSFPSAST